MLTLIMSHNTFSKKENEAAEAHMPRHRDSKTKKPRHRDSKTKKPRHRFSMEFWPLCPLTVTGLRKPEDDETNEDDALNVISTFTKEAGVDQTDFMKHVDKIHPIGGAKNGNQARIIKLTTHSFKEKVFLQHKRNKKVITEKRKKIQNASPRCGWTFNLLYHETELICLGKPMRRLKVMRTSNLLMPICMVIWSSY